MRLEKRRKRLSNSGASIGGLLHRIEDQLFRERPQARAEGTARSRSEATLRDGTLVTITVRDDSADDGDEPTNVAGR